MKKNEFSIAGLQTLQNTDIDSIDRDSLVDNRDVEVKSELPVYERMIDYIQQIGNPYCYRHGKYVVKISFTDTDVSLEDRLISYIRTKY